MAMKKRGRRLVRKKPQRSRDCQWVKLCPPKKRKCPPKRKKRLRFRKPKRVIRFPKRVVRRWQGQLRLLERRILQRALFILRAELARLRQELLDLLNARYQALREQLLPFLNQNVEVTTRYGTVQGVLVSVGNDYLEIREASGNIVLIPFENFVSISRI